MSGAIVAADDSENPNRIRVRQLSDKLSMLQGELDNEKMVSCERCTDSHPYRQIRTLQPAHVEDREGCMSSMCG